MRLLLIRQLCHQPWSIKGWLVGGCGWQGQWVSSYNDLFKFITITTSVLVFYSLGSALYRDEVHLTLQLRVTWFVCAPYSKDSTSTKSWPNIWCYFDFVCSLAVQFNFSFVSLSLFNILPFSSRQQLQHAVIKKTW